MQESFLFLLKAVTTAQKVSSEQEIGDRLLFFSSYIINFPEPPSESKYRQTPLPDRNRTFDEADARWPTKDENYYLMTQRKVFEKLERENLLRIKTDLI